MSAEHVTLVWQSPAPRSKHRLLLLAIADNANSKGVAEISTRTLARLTALDKTEVSAIAKDLIHMGFLKLVSKGQGAVPQRFKLTFGPIVSEDPEPEFFTDTNPSKIADTIAPESPDIEPAPPSSNTIVGTSKLYPPAAPAAEQDEPVDLQATINAIVNIAGLQPPNGQMFFWHRAEHKQALQAILDRHRLSPAQLVLRITDAVAAGRSLKQPVLSVSRFAELLEGKARK